VAVTCRSAPALVKKTVSIVEDWPWAVFLIAAFRDTASVLGPKSTLTLRPQIWLELKLVVLKRSGATARILCGFKSETIAPLQQLISVWMFSFDSDRLNFDGGGGDPLKLSLKMVPLKGSSSEQQLGSNSR
jgi:hypothetical protein